ncbi:MAG: MarR family winged helix-turn-helix transcriptional regulator [Rhodoglobus sp.]
MTSEMESHTLEGFAAAAIRFVRALERNREQIAISNDLTASDLRTLFWVAEHSSVTPKAIAEHLEMTTGAITAITNRLTARGVLHRVAHPSDRRSIFLELTESGHVMMRAIHADFSRMVAESTSSLTVKELAAFESALSRVANEVMLRVEN